MTLWYVTAVGAGLAGSLHCLGMCGPLAMALPVGRFPVGQRGLARACYHAGRLLAYSLLGAVVGTLGQGLLLTGLQRPVSVIAGTLLISWLVVSRVRPRWGKGVAIARRFTAPFARLLREPTLPHLAGLGFLNGLLPCGSVYLALVGAVVMPSPLGGAGYLLAFGLGTLPSMLSAQVLAGYLSPLVRQRLGRSLPLVTVALALLLIGRGLSIKKAPTNAGPIPVCHGAVANRHGQQSEHQLRYVRVVDGSKPELYVSTTP